MFEREPGLLIFVALDLLSKQQYSYEFPAFRGKATTERNFIIQCIYKK